MPLSLEDAKNMADLARLEIPEKELNAYLEYFDQILTLAREMNALDTANIEPTYTPLSGGMPFRPDIAQNFPQQEKLLGSAPDISGTSYVVPRIL